MVRAVQSSRAIGVILQAGDAVLVALRAGVEFGFVVGVVVNNGEPISIVALRRARLHDETLLPLKRSFSADCIR